LTGPPFLFVPFIELFGASAEGIVAVEAQEIEKSKKFWEVSYRSFFTSALNQSGNPSFTNTSFTK